jgi:dual specificity phosphatase 12
MGWVDQIPRAGKLFIGGLHALYQKPDLFEKAGITHIVSVLDFDIYEAGAFKQYEHLHLRLDDDPNENMLQHFPESNKFIEDALSSGGGVFVHCAMGKSRSAAIAVAYLMNKYQISPHRGLSQVCEVGDCGIAPSETVTDDPYCRVDPSADQILASWNS